MRRRLSIRCAVLLAAFAVVASSGSALASPKVGTLSTSRFAERRHVFVPRGPQAHQGVGRSARLGRRARAFAESPDQAPGRQAAEPWPRDDRQEHRTEGPGLAARRRAPADPGDPEHRGSRRPDGFRRARPHDRAVDQRRTARSVGGRRTRPRGPGRQPPDADHRSAGWRCDRRPAAGLLPPADEPHDFDSDGRVIYDSLHGRWLATEVSWDCDTSGGASFGNGYIDFAVSETADPTGDWEVHFLAFDDKLPDFPAPGTSTDKVGFASNMFSMTTGPACCQRLDLLCRPYLDHGLVGPHERRGRDRCRG